MYLTLYLDVLIYLKWHLYYHYNTEAQIVKLQILWITDFVSLENKDCILLLQKKYVSPLSICLSVCLLALLSEMYKKFDFSSNNAWIPQKKEWECTYKDPNSTHVSCRHIDMGENITSLVEVITKSQKQHIHGAVWIISRVSQSEKWRCCVVWWYSSRYFCICCQYLWVLWHLYLPISLSRDEYRDVLGGFNHFPWSLPVLSCDEPDSLWCFQSECKNELAISLK